jgi:hypothetical protein
VSGTAPSRPGGARGGAVPAKSQPTTHWVVYRVSSGFPLVSKQNTSPSSDEPRPIGPSTMQCAGVAP